MSLTAPTRDNTASIDHNSGVLKTYLDNLSAADIQYQKNVPGAVLSTLSRRMAHVYDAVADFGADPTGAEDSYAALQAWANACINDRWATGTINGLFKISAPLEFANIAGLTIIANCYIYPTFTTGDCVIRYRNGQNMRTYGRFEVSGQQRIGIQTGHKIYTDNGNGFSFSYFYGLCASDVAVGIQVGDLAYPSGLVSEMSFIGGYTAGTPCSFRAVGTQCYVNLDSFDAVSGAPGDLSVIQQYTIHVKGAQVKVRGGELQHNDNIFGSAVLVEPITDAAYANQYGSIEVQACHVESAAALCLIANLDGVLGATSEHSRVSFSGIKGYHSQNNGPILSTHSTAIADNYAGAVSTNDVGLYCGIVRTQPNILVGNSTHVYYDESGFGFNFVKGLQAVSGGILHFTNRPVCVARNANAQVLTTAVNTVIWTEVVDSDDRYRWHSNYGTGTFTVPVGGFKDVQVQAVLRVDVGNQISLDVYVDGVLKTLNVPTVQTGRVHAFLGDLSAGQVITVRASMSTGSASTNGGALEQMLILAAR